ncbi:hypothetical protein DFJ58DRAFT_419232 [Suillus subalutaceus]|uniref:uncharacterized protein n=1 Tax=Suillus subalutaceus TaxID=48586 RepID=UPI001B88253D|nr:uncharacterized protein DFJ58DRAFT_419232 [Suillus subalutaceus]KAG1851863.1 hypothetical protein DFJ58DRAFT_419232 [Suillus subalutaceus]
MRNYNSKNASFPASNHHLQHLNLLRVNMQTFNSNTDSPAVSYTPQNIRSDVVMHDVSGQNGVSYRHRQLVGGKAKILQSNSSHKRFSSAIWRLPTEILAQIFLYCIPEDGNWAPAPYLAPMLLTTVCRRWREVAVDMPSLWRRLGLEVGNGDWQQRAFCYDSYLKRSQGRQLSSTLECHNNDWTELRSLLQPYVDQISSISLCFFSGAGSLVMADFRRLEELVIYTDGSDPVLAVAQLPLSMRSLKLMDLWFNFRLLSGFNPLAWASLTNLEIVVDGLDSFHRLLCLCPNLSSLTMIGIFTAIETSETLAHANLQSLRISGHLRLDWIGHLGLFNAVTLHNLCEIKVRNIGQWSHEEFKAFLTRSQCPLGSLTFGGGVMTTDQQLAEYVTLFPCLELMTDPMLSRFYC